MIENSTQGLTLLDADLDAEVLGTEHHEPELERWAPGDDGRARRVAAELRIAGDDLQGRWIEVLVDGAPVGGLSPEAAARHARHIEAVIARGGRPAANGLVRYGPYGLELELRLPDPAAPVRAPLPPADPVAERPDVTFFPRERRSPPVPLLIGAGVLVLLMVVGVLIGSRAGDRPTASPATRPSTSAVPPTTTAPAPLATPLPSPAVEQVQSRVPTTTRAPLTTPRRTPVASVPAPVEPPPTAVSPVEPPPEPVAPAPVDPPPPSQQEPPPPCPDEQPGGLLGVPEQPGEECTD